MDDPGKFKILIMIKFIELLLIFFSLYHNICATPISPEEILIETEKVLSYYSDRSERDQIIASLSLGWSINGMTEDNNSIFKYNIEYIAKRSKIPIREQYIILMEALCEYLIKFCFETIKKSKKGELNTLEKLEFPMLLKNFSKEFMFFSLYEAPDFEIPDNTVNIIIKTLKLLEPQNQMTFLIISGLSCYCKSKSCIEPVFEMMRYFIKNNHREGRFNIGVALNQKLQALPEFDAFLRDLTSDPLNKYATPSSIIQTIVAGPITDYSNELLLTLITDQNVAAIARIGWVIQKLAYRIDKSNLYEKVIDKINPTSPIIEEFKRNLESYHESYNAIHKILEIDFKSLQPLGQVPIKAVALKHYYDIDKHLVVECVMKMNQGIFELVERIRQENSSGLLNCALNILALMPDKRIPELYYTSYEVILDLILEAEHLRNFYPEIISTVGFKNILRLYHSEITPTLLKKYWMIIIQCKDVDKAVGYIRGNLIIILYQLLVRPKIESPERFFNIFKMIHEFADSIEMDFTLFASEFFTQVVRDFKSTIAEEFIDYCKSNYLLSKTEILLAQKLLSK